MRHAPIGIFDSGLGGLTVAREIARALPFESFIYVGDTARCPYGPQRVADIEQYVREICAFLQGQGAKLIVIACNTATAAGLSLAQQEFDVPVIGVIEPGARAAVRATRNRRVGVIGTQGTIDSDVYSRAVRSLDAGCTVISVATPEYVEDVEKGLALEEGYSQEFLRRAIMSRGTPDGSYLDVLKRNDIDTLVLGCTHYPMLAHAITQVMGDRVILVSSAAETAFDVQSTLERRGHAAEEGSTVSYRFFTTGDRDTFERLGSRVFGQPFAQVDGLDFPGLSVQQ